jgi:hypothetical protein
MEESAEPAYRLETHFGQTTKLSGFHGRYRFSHAIPSGSEGEGFTTSWKWEEFDQNNIDELNQLIFVHDNENEVEYTGSRRNWRRDGATALSESISDVKFLLTKLENICSDECDDNLSI